MGPHRWVFGGVERGSGRCFIVPVPNRRAETLLPLIEQWVAPGTHIISDAWQAYNGVSHINHGVFSHSVIVHEDNFVDPRDSDIHTQTIESLWKEAKKKLRQQSGTSQDLFPSYLKEFMWRRNFKPNFFSGILVCIIQQYPC
jgi:transposase-like protein